MRVLIINAIVYTPETRDIPRVSTIKDTMIADLCLAFCEQGHAVTLFAAKPYKPVDDKGVEIEETYPFDIVWGRCALPGLFLPNRLPWMPELKKFLKSNDFDLIISSEVFSMSTLCAYKINRSKLLVWHELARHQNMMHQLPSKFWYNFVAKKLMKNLHVVARSEEAREFISQFCPNTEKTVIDHGVNLNKFQLQTEKENHFVVCSQLIPRKRIHGIIQAFCEYSQNKDSKLYIIGEGPEEDALKTQVQNTGLTAKVIFTGKLSHDELMPLLAGARALLVNTEKDNNMISIVESIAVGTPVITTTVPLNASYIQEYKLGIARDNWDADDLLNVDENNQFFVNNCISYREKLSTSSRVTQFINVFRRES